ncbi:general stress protein [Leptolyngbya sp. FACHB-261]|uniref:general stress protein n=1 Tax=Leptolyngbya sp. FACHB-261 TaxID=2692806 RepID=UPI001685ED9E|nr:general stress protein [Leptolyngbya sp. FACHB-261]MBD2104700.1 general stress protein [Leptolyngbya sp. FACHB-261]
MAVTQQSRAAGIFDNREAVEQALNELNAANFPMDKVSVIGKEAEQVESVGGAQTSERVGDESVETQRGLSEDVATASAWGTTLVGLSSLALPGVGPVLAAGSLAAALVATVTGSAIEASTADRLIHALTDTGMPQERALVYSNRLHRGDYLVLIEGPDEQVRQAESSLKNRGIEEWAIYAGA